MSWYIKLLIHVEIQTKLINSDKYSIYWYFYLLIIKKQNLRMKKPICNITGPSSGVVWPWRSPLQLLHTENLFPEGSRRKNFHQLYHPDICLVLLIFSTATHQLVLFASVSFLSSHSPSSHNFRQSWIAKESSAPSPVSLFLTSWYPNITHFLSWGVKGRSLEEMWRKKVRRSRVRPLLSILAALWYLTLRMVHICITSRVTCCFSQGSPEKQTQ